MFRKFLEAIVIMTGVALLADKEPYWCVAATIFVFFDVWDYIIGYIEFKKRVKIITAYMPEGASREKILHELLKDLENDNE